MTVEKKIGFFSNGSFKYQLIDLPGTYGIYPTSLDEQVVTDVLSDPAHPQHPDLGIVVGTPDNLKRAILLYQQVRELGIPALFVVNMMDEAKKIGINIDFVELEKTLGTKVIATETG